jgi:hypothetical protein
MRIHVDELRVQSDEFYENANSGGWLPDGPDSCTICGRSICAIMPVHFIHIVNYGNMFSDETEEGEDSLGWRTVGPCCFEKVKEAFGGSYPEVDPDVEEELDPSGEEASGKEKAPEPSVCDDFCVDNQGICHNCGYTEESHGKVKSWLCYYELHVDQETVLVHRVVDAKTKEEAIGVLDQDARSGEHFTLQAKGVLCLATETSETIEYLKDVK